MTSLLIRGMTLENQWALHFFILKKRNLTAIKSPKGNLIGTRVNASGEKKTAGVLSNIVRFSLLFLDLEIESGREYFLTV